MAMNGVLEAGKGHDADLVAIGGSQFVDQFDAGVHRTGKVEQNVGHDDDVSWPLTSPQLRSIALVQIVRNSSLKVDAERTVCPRLDTRCEWRSCAGRRVLQRPGGQRFEGEAQHLVLILDQNDVGAGFDGTPQGRAAASSTGLTT